MTRDLSELIEAYPSVVEAARYIVELFNERERADLNAAADAWAHLYDRGNEARPMTAQYPKILHYGN